MKAEEQAKKILWALMEATRIGEPMSVERKIIENGLIEYAKSQQPSEEEIEKAFGKIYSMGQLDTYETGLSLFKAAIKELLNR